MNIESYPYQFDIEDLRSQGFEVQTSDGLEGDFKRLKFVLIFPNRSQMFSIKWNADNIKFRSSLWLIDNKDKMTFYPVSLGYKKFFNLGESTISSPLPPRIEDIKFVEKIDGSSLLVSKFKDKIIARTRGTLSARSLDNGAEIDELILKYPKAFDNDWINGGSHTLIFEWTTPSNRIILDYGAEPKLWLTNCINHCDYSYTMQWKLDQIANSIGVLRPPIIKLSGSESQYEIGSAIREITNLRSKEGVCAYYLDDQEVIKIKTDDYIEKNSLLSGFSLSYMVQKFIEFGYPHESKMFLSQLKDKYGDVLDFEQDTIISKWAESIVAAHAKSIDLQLSCYRYIESLKGQFGEYDPNNSTQKKIFANEIISGNMMKCSNVCFNILNKREKVIDIRKTILYYIENE